MWLRLKIIWSALPLVCLGCGEGGVSGTVHSLGGEIVKNGDAIVEVDLNGAKTVSPATLQEIGQIATLRKLRFIGSPIGDDGLPYLKNLKNLETLDLSGTKVSDAGLLSLAELPKLKIPHHPRFARAAGDQAAIAGQAGGPADYRAIRSADAEVSTVLQVCRPTVRWFGTFVASSARTPASQAL